MHMLDNTQKDITASIEAAIIASENIIDCLKDGDFEAAKEYDLERASFIREMSKCRNLDILLPEYSSQLEKLSELNTSILKVSGSIRDEVLTDIAAEQANRLRHEQYIQNKRL